MGCSKDTLERHFAATIKKGKDRGKTSLRRFLWLSAEKGNVAMQIWLSKQILGMREPEPDVKEFAKPGVNKFLEMEGIKI